MLRLADEASNGELFISGLAGVEVTSAVCLLERVGKVSADSRRSLLDQFRLDEGWRYTRLPVTDAALGLASSLIERYALRAYDAVQLAGCLIAGNSGRAIRFVCSDLQLLAAAAAEQLETFNPESSRN